MKPQTHQHTKGVARRSSSEQRQSICDDTFFTIPSSRRPKGIDAIAVPDKKRILFVDDDDDTCELIAFCFPQFEIVTADSMAEGLLLAQSRRFELYLLDNWLPDGTGIELCRQIRQFDPCTPVIFYSAVANESDIQHALSAGAQAYVVKPESIEKLERVILQSLTTARVPVGQRTQVARLGTRKDEI